MTMREVRVTAIRTYAHNLRKGQTFQARVELRAELAPGEGYFQASRELQAAAESLVAAEVEAMDKRLRDEAAERRAKRTTRRGALGMD